MRRISWISLLSALLLVSAMVGLLRRGDEAVGTSTVLALVGIGCAVLALRDE